MKLLSLILSSVFVICFASCATKKDAPPTPGEKIAAVAKAYGLDSLSGMNKLSFTFNTKRDTATNARSWAWDVKNNMVTLTSDKENVTYKRDSVLSDALKKVDAKFINDQYWLLFPWHAAHDSGVTYTMKDSMLAPISHALTTKFTVQYNKDGGYTPGDAYDLYLDKDNIIKEWSYRPGGVLEPAMTTTWEENTKFGNTTTLALDHKNEKGDFRLFFTGVKVE